MPDDAPGQQLEWNEENLSKAISDLYTEASVDKPLHDRLMTDPFTVLNERIKIPDEFINRVFARERGARMLVMNVPPYDEAVQGTTIGIVPADYGILCTVNPPW